MKKYLTAAVLFAAPLAVMAQDVPAEGSTVEKLAIAVVVGIAGFLTGWVVKGVHAVEKMVANSQNKIDDKVLEVVTNAIKSALSGEAAKK